MGRLARIALNNVGSVLEKNIVIMLMDPVSMDVTLAIKELCVQQVVTFNFIKKNNYAAKLRTSIGIQNDREYGKSIMASHEISD